MKNLYLIPALISEDISCIPPHTIEILKKNRNFICERVRTTRRFIKSIIPKYDIDASHFIELDKRDHPRNNPELIRLIKESQDLCFISEAGCPCIADPGSEVVNLAREQSYRIHPLTGPSSILLALMASGLNGQNFTFRGYLPVKKDGIMKELKEIEKEIFKKGYSQIFIETPYRNFNIFEAILNTVNNDLRLNISYGIYSSREYLNTKSICEWKRDFSIKEILKTKSPCIFILGR